MSGFDAPSGSGPGPRAPSDGVRDDLPWYRDDRALVLRLPWITLAAALGQITLDGTPQDVSLGIAIVLTLALVVALVTNARHDRERA